MKTFPHCSGIMLVVLLMASAQGCHTTYNAQRTSRQELSKEGTILFVRPDKYSILGTRSIHDYIEITHQEIKANSAGYPVLSVGIRNRGGQHLWDWDGPEVQLSVQTAFYEKPIQPDGAASSPSAYRTNWQTVKLVRGQTSDYRASCPVKDATYYQMTISEYLK